MYECVSSAHVNDPDVHEEISKIAHNEKEERTGLVS